MFLSYEFDIASGAAIVLLAAGVFATVYAGTTLRRAMRPQPRPVAGPAKRPLWTRTAQADEHP